MVIKTLALRYFQLYLQPAAGCSKTGLYKDIVLRGKKPECVTDLVPEGFTGSAEDSLFIVQTPAGSVEIAYLANRNDFERAVQVLAYKCENQIIPQTMGAITIRGIINWRKIEKHQADFKKTCGPFCGWDKEFVRFTADKKNYTDTLIIISRGGYSGIPASRIGITEDDWLKDSLKIRMYHECTHFICRALFSEKIDALWDELLADCIGLCAAFGSYRTDLAKLFLGIAEDGTYCGGRLENYFPVGTALDVCAQNASVLIEKLDTLVKSEAFDALSDDSLFAMVLRIEKNF